MFENIGGKIKGLAKFITNVGMIGACLTGLIIWIGGIDSRSSSAGIVAFLVGLVVAGVGCLSAWIGSFLLYGFGEIIDLLYEIYINTRKEEPFSPVQPQATYQNHQQPVSPVFRDNSRHQNVGVPQNQNTAAGIGWQCECGRVNAVNVTSCVCGKSKREVMLARQQNVGVPQNQNTAAGIGWQCACGRVNAVNVTSCVCGKSKREVMLARQQQTGNTV